MDRPYIFCHMMTSLDGKIMGNYMETPEGAAAGDVFYRIAFGREPYYKHQGRLGWKNCDLTYEDIHAHVLEVLTGRASNTYKAFLRKLGISYMIAGEDMLDYGMALEKLKRLFGIETLMLGGGGVLNWSFIQAGLCEELSLVIAASADGSLKTPALFTEKEGLTTDIPVGFELEHLEAMDGGSIWLRYKVKK